MEAAKEWVLMGEEGFLCRDGWSAVAKDATRLTATEAEKVLKFHPEAMALRVEPDSYKPTPMRNAIDFEDHVLGAAA